MSTKAALAGVILGLSLGAAARAEEPLSAIDWLSDSVTQPIRPSAPSAAPGDVTPDTPPEEITVAPLDAPLLDAVGLLPSSVTGLPRNAWADSATSDLALMIASDYTAPLPAATTLLTTLLLAELDPPVGHDRDGQLLLARLDRLLALGALDQAQALLERAGPTDPALFRRWFDVSLLTGHEDRACAAMRAAPGIAPTFPARVFCMARGGDWNAALLMLDTAKALGHISEEEDALLIRFLDPELFEGSPPLVQPVRPSPLTFRMFEAIGEPIPMTGLPLAFAHADLRPTAGWKARIEAAERLARAGALEANQLLGIYTERLPAASGGVWDRVEALQRFDVAMLSGDPGSIARALPKAWAAMEAAELEVPFADLYGERLARLPLTGKPAALAFRIGLLSDSYESIAATHTTANAGERFLSAVAQGDVDAMTPSGPEATSIAHAFTGVPLGETLSRDLETGRLGEAILQALQLVDTGAQGDLEDITQGLALLRRVGLEDATRRIALQFLILERRG